MSHASQHTTASQEQTLVVGAALVSEGLVLAARRTDPPTAAGRWEFPGGKVETAESADEGVVREVREELGCAVVVRSWLRGEVWIKTGYRLRVAICRVTEGRPRALEHDELRWLRADDLGSVDWLDADGPFLPELATVLRDDLARQVRPPHHPGARP